MNEGRYGGIGEFEQRQFDMQRRGLNPVYDGNGGFYATDPQGRLFVPPQNNPQIYPGDFITAHPRTETEILRDEVKELKDEVKSLTRLVQTMIDLQQKEEKRRRTKEKTDE